MVLAASQIRTSLVVGAAFGTVIATLSMQPRDPLGVHKTANLDDGVQMSARFPTSRMLPGAQDNNLAVTITAPSVNAVLRRPPLALAIVIDRSGSMHGAPLDHAKAAALAMLRQLDERDAFAVVTYSSSASTVLPMQRATDSNKSAARAAIETIDDGGGTCISCGLEVATRELALDERGEPGLRRILLISDGQANQGVSDRDELAQLATGTAVRAISISTVGVGLDFDEATMRRLAEVGRGNYYFVEDTVALSAMFMRELAGLGHVVASAVQVVVTPAAGVQIVEAYGYPMSASGDHVVIPIADLCAGETSKVVLHVRMSAPPSKARPVVQVDIGWRQVSDGARRSAHTAAMIEVTSDPRAVAASADPAAMTAVEKALSARALEQAAAAYDKTGLAGAQQILEQRVHAVRANAQLAPATVQELEAASNAALDGFVTSPAKARKVTSVKAHELAR